MQNEHQELSIGSFTIYEDKFRVNNLKRRRLRLFCRVIICYQKLAILRKIEIGIF